MIPTIAISIGFPVGGIPGRKLCALSAAVMNNFDHGLVEFLLETINIHLITVSMDEP